MLTRILAFTITIAILLGGFQNCLSTNRSSSASSNNSSGGSGNGYDGKTFVHFTIGRICPDLTPIESSIEFRSGIPYLVRDDCANLPASAQRPVQVQTDSQDASYVIYQGVMYVDAMNRITSTAVDRDGNTIMVGQLIPPGTLNWWEAKWKYTYIAKLDAQDRLLWAYKVSGSIGSEFNSIALRPDGSIVVAGQGVLAFSSGGDLLWSNTYTSSGSVGSLYWTPDNIVADGQGALYLSASTSLLKLNSSGEILWQKENSIGIGFLAIGPDQSVYSAVRGNLQRFGPDGTALWSTDVDNFNLNFHKLLVRSDGSFLVAGSVGLFSGGIVGKYNPAGQAVWLSQLTGGSLSLIVDSIVEGANGFVISGERAGADWRGFIGGLNPDGSVQWSIDHPSILDGELYSRGNALRIRANAAFAPQAGVQESYFLDLKPLGNSFTCENCTPFTVNSAPYTFNAPRPGQLAVDSSLFSKQPYSVELIKLQLKVEVRE